MRNTFKLIVFVALLPLISTRRRTSSGNRNSESRRTSSTQTLFDGVFIGVKAGDWFKATDNNGKYLNSSNPKQRFWWETVDGSHDNSIANESRVCSANLDIQYIIDVENQAELEQHSSSTITAYYPCNFGCCDDYQCCDMPGWLSAVLICLAIFLSVCCLSCCVGIVFIMCKTIFNAKKQPSIVQPSYNTSYATYPKQQYQLQPYQSQHY